MKTCVHCGSEVPDESLICPKCGYYTVDHFQLILCRAKQFFLINPAIQVNITGTDFSQTVSLNSGETKHIPLPPGNYQLDAHLSFRNAKCSVTLDRTRMFQLFSDRFSGRLVLAEMESAPN